MRSRPTLLTRALEPLAAGLWISFVLLSILVGIVWSGGIGDAHLAQWIPNASLSQALLWLLQRLDFAWVTLAAANVYAAVARCEGLSEARSKAGKVILSVLALVVLSAFCGYPLGSIQYSTQLGPKLGPVALSLPLLWLTIILGARETVRHFFPRWSHGQTSLAAGLLVLLTDLSLEPLAANARGWWFWRADEPTLPPIFAAPLTTPLVWGIVGYLTALQFRDKNVVASTRRPAWRPIAALAIFHGVFLATHFGRWLRG